MRGAMLGMAVLAACSGAAEYVWVEGEEARSHSMRRHGWYDGVAKENLSDGEWLSHFAEGPQPEAEYAFEVSEAGRYDFWVRCNTVAGARLSCKLGSGPWKQIDVSRPVGLVNIASDGKPDMRFIAWVRVGEVGLQKGKTAIRFRFESENHNHGAIDCFVLSREPFRPRGALRPGERSGRANAGFFAWEPSADRFGAEALVDLSSLNEDVAGRRGRVRAAGGEFRLGDGRPVRFWAGNAGPGIWGLDHDSHVYLAKRLAKTGVNMVRLHGAIYGARDPKVNRERLDDLHHLVHALKEEGIYTALSFFFPLWFHLDGDMRPFMLLFFDEDLQKLYYAWAKTLLTTKNPYTGMPLGRDPAVAIVEIVNEDSHFFWTFDKKNMPERRWREFTALYGSWLKKRYGSLEKALEAWGGVRESGDDPAGGRMELYAAWHMTAQGLAASPARRPRVSDQVRFLTENMRGFYEKTIRYFRSTCRYDGLVSCSNWHVADPAVLDALERYCYTAGDVIDHHGYYDHGHEGEAANWSVRPGQQFTSRSALDLELSNPIPYVETEGYPHICSEIGWPMPNMYRAEFTFLTSAYGSLQGLDGVFSFAIGSAGWDQRIGKFPMSTPATLGCFPAAALIYRKGFIAEAPAVVRDGLNLEDLYALKGTSVYAAGAFDQLRSPSGSGETSGLVFYAGRVVRNFRGDSARTDVAKLIDREKKVVSSITGELRWDYGRGIVTMEAESAQGAAGFLGRAGTVELEGIAIDMDNDYGTVTAVALDGEPLVRSKSILIQVMTIEQFHGFEASGAGNLSGRIESVGSAPMGVERFHVTVTLRLKGSPPKSVVACDEHGYPTSRKAATSGSADAFAITLDETSPYHVVVR